MYVLRIFMRLVKLYSYFTIDVDEPIKSVTIIIERDIIINDKLYVKMIVSIGEYRIIIC